MQREVLPRESDPSAAGSSLPTPPGIPRTPHFAKDFTTTTNSEQIAALQLQLNALKARQAQLPAQSTPTTTTESGKYPAEASPPTAIVSATVPGSSPYVVQYSKPRESDTVDCKPFPKAGNTFKAWQDFFREAVMAASAASNDAFRWILEVEDPTRTFQSFTNTGAFTSLDGKILLALNKCIPGDNHALRQKINGLKLSERVNNQATLTGRQVLWLIYEHFKINRHDQILTDMHKLQHTVLAGGNLREFKYSWDDVIGKSTQRPTEEILHTFFLLQIDQLPQSHDFWFEYKMWQRLPQADQTYDSISELVDKYLRDRLQQDNRRQAIGETITDIGIKLNGKKGGGGGGKGPDGGKFGPSPCFSWLNFGSCPHKDSGCKYDHEHQFKGVKRQKGADGTKNGGGKNGGKRERKGKGKGDTSKGKDPTKTGKSTGKALTGKYHPAYAAGAAPTQPAADPNKRKVVTDMSKICKAYLAGKCHLGKSCQLHHNEPCKQHSEGKCTRANCPFPHWNVQVNAAGASLQGAPGDKGTV